MFFLYDANLKLLKTIPSDVYQGSDGADDIYFLIPINPNAAIDVAFLLPTGKTNISRAATKQGEAVGLKTPDGIAYSMWSITLTAQETAYAGNVTLQLTVSAGVMSMTSQKGVFPVLTGVPPVLPEAPTSDVYTDIRAAIAALQEAVYNTKAIGIAEFGTSDTANDPFAYVQAYKTDAEIVVVPDYIIKNDEYYIVTSILSTVPQSVTEYEFGANVTLIGSGAFYQAKIDRLEFPKTLTSIRDAAFKEATTTEFIFNGAVPTIGSFAFSGVNATVYVPTVYYDDYVAAFETYPGIVVQKKSETLADVIRTADEAKAIAEEAKETADEAQAALDGKLDKKTNITTYGEAYVKEADGSQKMFSISAQPVAKTIARRTDNGAVRVTFATADDEAVNRGQVKTLLQDKLNTTDIVQETGSAEDKVMSQKAVTNELNTKLDVDRDSKQCVYAVNQVREQEMVKYSEYVYPFSIAYRNENGELAVADATSNENAVSLGQLIAKLLGYLPTSGGTITNDLAIQGNLTVRGTTTTTIEETLNVKDAIIVANADGADLSATLAGFVIRVHAEDCYGIIYDFSSNSIKLGLGQIAEGKFVFYEGEGNAVAVRADGSLMSNGHLVKWDATALKFVDAGKSVDDIKSDTLAALTSGDNISITKASNSEKVTISATGLVKKTATKGIYATDDGEDLKLDFATSPINWGVPRYNGEGKLKTVNPTDPLDAVNKQYFEANAFNQIRKVLVPADGKVLSYNELKSLATGFYWISNSYKLYDFPSTTDWINLLVYSGSSHASFIVYTTDNMMYVASILTDVAGTWVPWKRLATTSDIISAINEQSFKTINGESIKGSGNIAIGGVSSIGGKTGDVTLGTGLSMSGNTLNADSGSGGTTYYRHMVQGKLNNGSGIYYIYMSTIMSQSTELGAFSEISDYIQNTTDIVVAFNPNDTGEPSYYDAFVSAVMINGTIYFIGSNNMHIGADTSSIDFISDVVEEV